MLLATQPSPVQGVNETGYIWRGTISPVKQETRNCFKKMLIKFKNCNKSVFLPLYVMKHKKNEEKLKIRECRMKFALGYLAVSHVVMQLFHVSFTFSTVNWYINSHINSIFHFYSMLNSCL